MSEAGGGGVAVGGVLTSGDSWLAGKSDVSGGDSATELIENTTPPVVIISSRVKSPGKRTYVVWLCMLMRGVAISSTSK